MFSGVGKQMVNAEFSRIYRFVKLLVNEGFLAVWRLDWTERMDYSGTYKGKVKGREKDKVAAVENGKILDVYLISSCVKKNMTK